MTDSPFLQAYLGHWPVVDPTAYIHPRATLIGEVVVGPESTVWPNATLRGDDGRVEIGARTSIQDGVVLHGTELRSYTVVGDQCTVGHNSTVHGAHVGNNCIVGMGSILLDNAIIGEFCLIGAGTLITQGKQIPPYSLVMGSPGKVVRRLNDAEIAWIGYSWRRYVEQGKIYRGG